MPEQDANTANERLKRAKRLFLAASQQPSESRVKFVVDSVGVDQELCDEVLGLLNAAEKPDSGIEDIVAEAALEVGITPFVKLERSD